MYLYSQGKHAHAASFAMTMAGHCDRVRIENNRDKCTHRIARNLRR